MKTQLQFLLLLLTLFIHQSVFSQEIKSRDTTQYNFFQIGLAGGLSNTLLNLSVNSGYYIPLEYNAHISFLFSPTPLIGIDFQVGTNISNLNFKFSDFDDVISPNPSPEDTTLVLQNRGYYFGVKGNLDILYLFRYAPRNRIFKWTLDAGFGGIFYEPGAVFYQSGYNSFSGNKYIGETGLSKIKAKGLTPIVYVGTSFWFKLGERFTLGLNTGYNYQPLFAFDRSDTKNYVSRRDYWQTSIKFLVTIGSSKNNNKFFAHYPSAVPVLPPVENVEQKTTIVLPQDSTTVSDSTMQKNGANSSDLSDEKIATTQDSTSTVDSTHTNKHKQPAVKDSTKRKPLQFDKTVEKLTDQQRQQLDSLIRYKGYFSGKGTTLTSYSQKGMDNVIRLLKKYPAARIDLNLYDGTALAKEIPVKLQRDDVIEYLVKSGIDRIRIGGNAFDRALNPRVKETPDKQRCIIIYLAK